MHFLFGDDFINSRNLLSWLCIGIVRRKFMLVTIEPGAGGLFPYKRLLGMCRGMGSHFHDWRYWNGVANFRILGVSRDSKWEDARLKKSESCCLLNLTISSH